MARVMIPAAVALAAGIALWTATSIVGGRSEPWDSGLYWSTSYPAAILLSALLGLLFPHRPWRWAALLVCSQLLVMAATASGLSLLPLGLALLAVLSVPPALAAETMAALRRRAE